MTIAVTGHRPDKLGREWDMKGPISQKIYTELDRLVQQLRPTKMITGMALGVDILFANVAFNRKIPFVAAIPCLNQEKKWSESQQKLYWRILNDPLCSVHYVSIKPYSPSCMQKRNEWMVDNCQVLISIWDGSPGGTANCVMYAVDRVDVRRINPKEL
jgi:uncharacterized phage-like protein YoqJ